MGISKCRVSQLQPPPPVRQLRANPDSCFVTACDLRSVCICWLEEMCRLLVSGVQGAQTYQKCLTGMWSAVLASALSGGACGISAVIPVLRGCWHLQRQAGNAVFFPVGQEAPDTAFFAFVYFFLMF